MKMHTPLNLCGKILGFILIIPALPVADLYKGYWQIELFSNG